MFYVKRMSVKDFEFAVRLTDMKGWNFVKEDFEFMLKLEPEGCFVLFDNSKRVGVVTSISFGEIGWLGSLIVDEEHRKKGAGELLARQVINYLTIQNVQTVGLYTYIDTMPFYEKLGFKYESEFLVLEGKAFASPVKSIVKEARKEDLQKIIAYDLSCFGASRKKLLKLIFRKRDNLCYLSMGNGQMLGYITAKVHEGIAEVGPLVCKRGRSDIAIDLLKTVLNKLEGFQVSYCVPKKELAILNFLADSEVRERFRVARMFFKPLKIKDCIYIAESLERG